MQIPFSVMAQQLSLDVLHKRKCSNNIDEIIKKASHFKKVIPQTSEASQCYMTALDTRFDRYPKRTVKRSKRCHLDSWQLSSCCCFYHKGSKDHRKPKRHGRQTQIVMNQTKRGQIRPGRKCTTVNWMQGRSQLRTPYLQWDKRSAGTLRKLTGGWQTCMCMAWTCQMCGTRLEQKGIRGRGMKRMMGNSQKTVFSAKTNVWAESGKCTTNTITPCCVYTNVSHFICSEWHVVKYWVSFLGFWSLYLIEQL